MQIGLIVYIQKKHSCKSRKRIGENKISIDHSPWSIPIFHINSLPAQITCQSFFQQRDLFQHVGHGGALPGHP